MVNRTNIWKGPRKKRQPYKRYPNVKLMEYGHEVEMVDGVDPLIRLFFEICVQDRHRLADVLGRAGYSIAVPRTWRSGKQTNIETVINMFGAVGYRLEVFQEKAPNVVEKYDVMPLSRSRSKQWPKAHPWVQVIQDCVFHHNLKLQDVYRNAGVGMSTSYFWFNGKKTVSLQNYRKVANVLGLGIRAVRKEPPRTGKNAG